jgi:hypothetical protein
MFDLSVQMNIADTASRSPKSQREQICRQIGKSVDFCTFYYSWESSPDLFFIS